MHLFNKENIWSNPHASSHPDKYNNSVNRIISKEEEREDPRRDSSIYLRVVFPQIIQELQDFFEYSVFYSVSTRNPATPSNSAYRINSSPRNTTTTRLIPCHPVQAPSSNCSPCLQAFYRQNKAPSFPTALQGHTAQAGFQ